MNFLCGLVKISGVRLEAGLNEPSMSLVSVYPLVILIRFVMTFLPRYFFAVTVLFPYAYAGISYVSTQCNLLATADDPRAKKVA